MKELPISKGPEVYLVSYPELNGMEFSQFTEDHKIDWWLDGNASSAESLPEIAGRLCYMSFNSPRPGGNKAYLKHILEASHGSVVEHSNWGFIFTGVSRTLTHELVRHRAGWSYSQLSQRYVDESDAEFICPESIRNEEALFEIWKGAIDRCRSAYDYIVGRLEEDLAARDATIPKTELRKKARQAARSVLPNATETKIYATANARSIRHFIEMRCSRHAETEIRVLAGKVWKIMVKEAPNLFGDYTQVDLPDGTFELTTPFRKV